MPQLTKLAHEKLLAAIDTAKQEAVRQGGIAARLQANIEGTQKAVLEAERALKLEKDAVGLAAVRLDLAQNKIKRLREERVTRDQTIVRVQEGDAQVKAVLQDRVLAMRWQDFHRRVTRPGAA